jgi:hypothetical protein
MRRYFAILMLIAFSLTLLLTAGCPKETIRDTAEEGEEQPDPGPDGPRPPGGR